MTIAMDVKLWVFLMMYATSQNLDPQWVKLRFGATFHKESRAPSLGLKNRPPKRRPGRQHVEP